MTFSVVNTLIASPKWKTVVFSRDFHPTDHCSFASNNPGTTLFTEVDLPNVGKQMMWPDHCVQGSRGSEFHAEIHVPDHAKVVLKGTNKEVDSYSAFMDNKHGHNTELDPLLKEQGITDIYLVGLAHDYCVYYTAMDGINLGYNVYFITDGTKGITEEGVAAADAKMASVGVRHLTSAEVLSA